MESEWDYIERMMEEVLSKSTGIVSLMKAVKILVSIVKSLEERMEKYESTGSAGP